MKKTAERRVFLRKPLLTDVVFEDEFGEGLFRVSSCDVSMGGIFLTSRVPVRLGTMVFLSFTPPPYKRPIKVTGQVVRVVKGGGELSSGFGIRFVGLSNDARKRLGKFLSPE